MVAGTFVYQLHVHMYYTYMYMNECEHLFQAMEVAVLQDRMHLKPTYYSYAKHAEAVGEYTAAINRLDRKRANK